MAHYYIKHTTPKERKERKDKKGQLTHGVLRRLMRREYERKLRERRG